MMLVISRKPGETIVIGEQIRLTIIEVQHGRVKLGLTAPATVPIVRAEVRERQQDGAGDEGEQQAPPSYPRPEPGTVTGGAGVGQAAGVSGSDAAAAVT